MNIMKAIQWAVVAIMGLCIISCANKQGQVSAAVADSVAENMVDSVADSVVVANNETYEGEPLQFESVTFSDSLISKVKIMDYSSGVEPTPYKMGKMRNYYKVQTLEAVGGNPGAVEFVNQWLTLEAASEVMAQQPDLFGDVTDKPFTAAEVAAKYAKLKKLGIDDVRMAIKKSAQLFLEGEVMDELPFETGSTLESRVEPGMNTGKLLTVYVSGSQYPAGAAHDIPWAAGNTLDLKNLRVLTLDDVVKPESRSKVLQMIVADLKEQGYEEGGLEADVNFPDASPVLVEDGVEFDYGAYEIGPFSMGMPSVTLSYEKMRPYLTTDVKDLLEMK